MKPSSEHSSFVNIFDSATTELFSEGVQNGGMQFLANGEGGLEGVHDVHVLEPAKYL